MKRLFRHCLVFLLMFFNLGSVHANNPAWLSNFGNKAIFSSAHVKAELVIHAPQGVVAGEDVWLGLKIEHQPEWHTYWQNPGDVGVATQLDWVLPEGVGVSKIHWPTPQVLNIADDIIDYGYEGVVLLPVKLIVADDFQADHLNIRLKASWLVCRVECIPEAATLELEVPSLQATVSEVGLFEDIFKQLPVIDESVSAFVQVEVSADAGDEGRVHWTVQGLPRDWQNKNLTLLPEQKEVLVNSGAESQEWDKGVWNATYRLSHSRSTEPEILSAVLLPTSITPSTVEAENGTGLRIQASVTGKWPSQKVYEIPPSLWEGGTAGATNNISMPRLQTSLLLVVGFAFLGGLLLNLMPCVFPVLSITALSLVTAGQHDLRTQKMGGFAHGVGIIFTLLLLAGVLLILRAGGAALGWGFQLQSPVFVSLLSILFVLIALNLFGVYEVKLFLPLRISQLRNENPIMDSFLSGIVTVLVATPCTAPFMGAALGAALVLPAWQTLLIFLALGVGLALPLMLLAFIPQFAKILPAPGAWMQTFKQLMAFPMLLAALWLVWIVSIQVGVNGAAGLLIVLLCVAFLMWVLGWAQRTSMTSALWKASVALLAVVLLIGASCWFVTDIQERQERVGARLEDVSAGVDEEAPVVGVWETWSPERVEQLLEQGREVFVDFTAAWCVTCQMNDKTTLSRGDVMKAFAEKNVALLKADWTNNDPRITLELVRLGRGGVPVYAFYKKGTEPRLLPEVLTPQIVYDALNQ